MATPLPAPFKNADISRFAVRAKELERYKPVIAYWCNYYIVNQILNKGLHTESDECMNYTTTLMDRLEKFKSDNAENDTVHDDVAAQAFVEQFALETFSRADSAVRANKATAQTAQAFQAASTFLDLMGIWQTPLNQEIAAKSKFAKFHGLRIAKALRNGEDPNLSNPVQEQPISPPALSPDDPEVEKINSLQPSVEDSSDHSRPPSFIDRPPPTARSPSIQTSLPPNPQPEVSPLEPSPNEGYFPNVPTFTSEQSVPNLPTASSGGDVVMTSPGPSAAPISPPPQDFYNIQSQQAVPPAAPSEPQIPAASSPPPQTFSQPQTNYSHTPSYQAPPVVPQAFIPSPQPTVIQAPMISPQPSIPIQQARTVPGQYIRDDEAVLAAQKHAKWAISALNFEDVDTAVKELRIALRALGAS